eukprot:Selendium_serpulae@DN3348_c0_g1_i3.p1
MPSKASGSTLALLEEQIPSKIFSRFVQAGRLAFIQYGPDAGKLAIIVDIIDQCRLLVDGPTTGVTRQSIPIKRIRVTDFVLEDLERSSESKVIVDSLKKNDVIAQWNKSREGLRYNQNKARANLTDFERFKIRSIRKQRAYEVKKILDKAGTKKENFGIRIVPRRKKNAKTHTVKSLKGVRGGKKLRARVAGAA